MAQYISKSALVAEIERRLKANGAFDEMGDAAWWEDKGMCDAYKSILSFVDTLEVIDPYITCIQYTNREAAIKAHAEDYSWNIESELFQQLTPEQQKLWRKEIEQAVISGGYSGLNLAKDPRYKENLEVKEVELSWENISAIISIDQQVCGKMGIRDYVHNHQKAMEEVLKRFKAQKGESV